MLKNRLALSFLCLGINVSILSCQTAFSQTPNEFYNTVLLNKLNTDKSYTSLRNNIITEFKGRSSGNWGEFVKGVARTIYVKNKSIAFTFDACGGKNGNGYDKELIEYLRQEKIPATLFVSGKWIDSQFQVFLELSRDTLFEIDNHGLNHKPCSIDGESAYGIKGTTGIGEAFDEIEANARKIEAITGHKPHYYRSATAFTDEACVSMASELGVRVVSYQVLSGDAVPFIPDTIIVNNVIKKTKPGAIIIMHFNHPEWNTKEAMEKIVPELRKKGYSFVRLNDSRLILVK